MTFSISKLKANPSKAISEALEYPVAIENRNEVQAYLLGKDLYESLVSYIENLVDIKAIEKTDFSKGKNFDDLTKELGI